VFTPEAQQAWVDLALKLATVRLPVLRVCTPGYLNNEGHNIDESFCKNTQFWSGPVQFIQMLREWRADGNLPGVELTK
jgi:cyclohexanone monooxygenase